MTPPASELLQKPAHLGHLFWSFSTLALQGFGGVVAVAQRVLVDKNHWLTREKFIEDWAVAQVLPGPNVVNLSIIIGTRFFGLKGACVALAGMLFLPLCVVLCLAMLYNQFQHIPSVAGALRGMTAVAAGLIIGSGLKLAGSLKHSALGLVLCTVAASLTFIMVAILRWPQSYVLLGLGLLFCIIAWYKLKQQANLVDEQHG